MREGKAGRRGFIASSLTGIVSIFSASSLFARDLESVAPDESWLRGLSGKHRQFFDVGAIQGGTPLRRVHNFIATYPAAYGIKQSDVNAVFGAHGQGLGFVLADSAWSKYELGVLYSLNDPTTGKPAVRNMFVEMSAKIGNVPPEASISSLQARGVRFIGCNNTVNSLSEQLAAKLQTDVAGVRADLLSSILPGVTVVPAMAIAGNRAQESGLTYASLG